MFKHAKERTRDSDPASSCRLEYPFYTDSAQDLVSENVFFRLAMQ